MMENFNNMMGGNGMMSGWGQPFNWGFGPFWNPLLLVLLIWTIYWKYHALWHAAKHDNRWWFLALLVVNTLGILEILYLYVFSKNIPGHDEKNVPMMPQN